MRVAQRDRWIVTLYHKHFDLCKTRCATTDHVTWKATVDVCNRIDFVAHDLHRLGDKLAIFIQRWYTFFCSAKSLVFRGWKIFVAGLVYVVSIRKNANGNRGAARIFLSGGGLKLWKQKLWKWKIACDKNSQESTYIVDKQLTVLTTKPGVLPTKLPSCFSDILSWRP